MKKITPKFTPDNCPHCEYDRRFPGFESGGWMQQDNNGPIVSCPICNDDGKHPPRETYHQTLSERWASDSDDTIFTPMNGKEKK